MSFLQILAPIIKKIPFTIYDIGKKIFNFIKELNIENTPEINQKSSVQDISKMAETLNDIRSNVTQISSPVIQDIKNSVSFYVEELQFLMDNKVDILKKYNFSNRSFDSTLTELSNSIQTFWDKEINKQISFDNAKCRSILALPTGKKKENEMQAFITDIIQETTIAYTKYIEKILYHLYDDFEVDIANIIKRLEANLDAYKQMDISVLNKDSLLYKKTIEQSQFKILICTEIINRLEK